MNARIVKAAKKGETIWDRGEKTSVTGLHVRVVSDSRKSFYLKYRTQLGQQRRPKIGDVGMMSIAQARSIARDILNQVANGEDPKAELRVRRGEPTIQDVFEEVWENEWNAEGSRTRESGWARVLESYYRNHAKEIFGHMRLTELKPGHLRDFISAKKTTPTAANRALEVISKLYTYAQERELVPQGLNPCKLVKKNKERKRGRYATDEELRKILPILDRYAAKHPRPVALLKCILLTGSRPSALERAMRSEFTIQEKDGERFGILRRHGKTSEDSGEDEVVVFPPEAVRIVESLPLPLDGTLFGVTWTHHIWQRVRKEAGCTDLWKRDLRRTFATIGISKAGVTKSEVGANLNHRDPRTTDIYAKLVLDSRMDVTSKISKQISKLR